MPKYVSFNYRDALSKYFFNTKKLMKGYDESLEIIILCEKFYKKFLNT